MEDAEEEEAGGAPGWITTFADLMSLLLTFFILMLSFSSMRAEQLKQMVTAVRQSMGVTQNQFSNVKEDVDIPAIVERMADTPGTMGMDDTENSMKSFVASKGFSSNISIEKNNRGVVMRIKNDLLFIRGSAELSKKAFPVLDEFGRIIRNKVFFISVEGHTDNLNIRTIRYPSNWELGADRAGSVARYLISEGHMAPSRFLVTSFGATMPLVENDTDEHRAENRRVEIVLSREK